MIKSFSNFYFSLSFSGAFFAAGSISLDFKDSAGADLLVLIYLASSCASAFLPFAT